MKHFIVYLQKNGFVPKSIQRAVYCAGHYVSWMESANLKTEEIVYKDLLNYMGYLQALKKSKPVINEHLRSVSHYYRSLQLPDIAYQVRVRGVEHAKHTLFNEVDLTKLYTHYEVKAKKGYWRYSDKLLLSLTIYQALDEKDIFRIELAHLNLAEGTLYVPSGHRRKVARKLELQAHQILQLHHYIENYRDEQSEKLISPQAMIFTKLHDQFKEISKAVKAQSKEIHLHVDRLSQLRQSRITIWIKQYGLRKAQYMAGFRRVENVERYRQQDTDDLRQYVLQFHPLQ